MIFFLGCDVAKSKLDVSLINEQGIEQWTDKLPNDTVAITTYLLTIMGAYPEATLCCVAEATGCFHHPLAAACYALGIDCRVYNAILTRQQIKATVRGKKTDRTDALLIARMGLRGEGRLYTPEVYLVTKYAARAGQQLGVLSRAVQLYQRHVESVLEDELSTAASELLVGIQTQFKAARAQFIAATAASAPPELMRLLRTIPGVGPYIAASLIGEIQNMQRFTTAKAVIAYAGLDPRIKQSGKCLNSTGRLTKRGSSYLRRTVFIAASVARRYDPQFKALYDKKRDEGKTYTVATCVVARKLLTVIRSVWLSGKDYELPDIFR